MCTEAVPCGEASSRYVIPSTYSGTEPKALSTIPTMNTDRYVLLSYTLSLAHLPDNKRLSDQSLLGLQKIRHSKSVTLLVIYF